MSDAAPLSALEPLIGTWSMVSRFPSMPDAGDVAARTTFEWGPGQQFVLQHSTVDHPAAPDAHMVIGADPGRPGHYLQHYFDSRGVARIYEMTFDDHSWTLLRTEPDFTPLEFCQRYVGTLSDDGRTITGAWQSSPDGGTWSHDFELIYTRAESR